MRISIPNPCHEDWSQMTPEDKGRFCLSCQKTVVDFTKMNKSEIQQYFQTTVNEKICGRIKTSDLVQDNILPEVHVYPNRFLVAPNHTPSRLFLMTVSMIFLYSCNNSIDNLEKEQHLTTLESQIAGIDSNDILIGDTVVLPEKSSDNYPFALGKIVKDSTRVMDNRNKKREPICPPPPDEFFDSINMPKPLPPAPLVGEIMGDVNEIDPGFPGGDAALYKFIKDNIYYDTNKMIAGKVYVRFVVDKDGSVTNVTIARGLSPTNDTEAIRVVSLFPNFTPGYEGGKARKTPMVIPIVFK